MLVMYIRIHENYLLWEFSKCMYVCMYEWCQCGHSYDGPSTSAAIGTAFLTFKAAVCSAACLRCSCLRSRSTASLVAINSFKSQKSDSYILTNTYMHIYYTYIHTYIHIIIDRYSSCTVQKLVDSGLHTYIHTYIHLYIHTCIHTYIYTYIGKLDIPERTCIT